MNLREPISKEWTDSMQEGGIEKLKAQGDLIDEETHENVGFSERVCSH